MPEKIEPEDVPETATVSDVVLAVESLALTVDSLRSLIVNLVKAALFALAVFMLASAVAVMLP